MTFQPPERGAYEVLLREFDWANAPQGDDPHYWTVADLRLNGRSLLADFRALYPGYGAQYVAWDTALGRMAWGRTQDEALAYAEELIQYHRDHYFTTAA